MVGPGRAQALVGPGLAMPLTTIKSKGLAMPLTTIKSKEKRSSIMKGHS